MTEVNKRWMLWVALIVSLAAYQLWPYTPSWTYNGIERKPYYIGVAAFIAILCVFIIVHCGRHLVTILLFILSTYNLIKELFLDPEVYNWWEWTLIIVTSIAWYALKKIWEFEQFER